MTNIFMGIAFHAIGGIAAATCFLPQKGTPNWTHQSYWLIFCLSAWIILPITVAFYTVPNLLEVLAQAPLSAMFKATWMGALYGFGGMAFGVAIRYIGFSLTYSIAIGISAVLGTVIPSAIAGTLISSFSSDGGLIVLAGFITSTIGVIFCGKAGILKENEIEHADSKFDMKKGLLLACFAGALSAVFSMALAAGKPIDDIAASYGATNFKGNATYIFAMAGAFITNLVWWSVVHFKQNTWREYAKVPETEEHPKKQSLGKYFFFAILSGVLWYGQFFFYGLGHVRMGNFEFISWGIHMAMLIFFSFGVGWLLKEWKGYSAATLNTLYFGLAALLLSFCIISYGSWMGS